MRESQKRGRGRILFSLEEMLTNKTSNSICVPDGWEYLCTFIYMYYSTTIWITVKDERICPKVMPKNILGSGADLS